jgi:hypothetical protein
VHGAPVGGGGEEAASEGEGAWSGGAAPHGQLRSGAGTAWPHRAVPVPRFPDERLKLAFPSIKHKLQKGLAACQANAARATSTQQQRQGRGREEDRPFSSEHFWFGALRAPRPPFPPPPPKFLLWLGSSYANSLFLSRK